MSRSARRALPAVLVATATLLGLTALPAAAAPTTGTVTGTVVDAATRAALPGICVSFEDASLQSAGPWQGWQRSCTDASGVYTLTGVPAGTSLLRLADDSATYPTRYSGGSYKLSRATPVVVTAGATTVVPKTALPRGAVLTGTALRPDGTPAVGACPSVYFGRGAETPSVPYPSCANTMGDWSIAGLPKGGVTVSVEEPWTGFPRENVTTWLPGVDRQRDATLYTLAAGESRDTGATTLLVGGVVTGVVRNQVTDAPIPGVIVNLSGHDETRAGGIDGFYGAVTGSDGVYRIVGVPAGTYHPIAYTGPGEVVGAEWLGGATDPAAGKSVRVTLGATVTKAFSLGAGASVTGGVTVAGLPVADGYGSIEAYTAVSGSAVGISTDVQGGRFTIAGLAPGTYKLAIRPSAGPEGTLTWFGGSDLASATTITVTAAGATVTWALP